MKRLNLILFSILASCSDPHSQSLPENRIREVKEATVFIRVTLRHPLTGEELNSSGSGFLISPYGHIATNYHVIQAMYSVYGIAYPAPVKDIRVIIRSGTKNHQVYEGRILAVDKENDVALIGVRSPEIFSPLVMESPDGLTEASPVWVFGYPYGEMFSVIQRGPEITVTTGSITALRHDDRDELQRVQIDASVSPGNSGGPLVNQVGKVIGVVNISSGMSRINFAVPAGFLNRLIYSLSLTQPIPDSSTLAVSSNPPDALLYVDGNFFGATPVSGFRIPFGFHALSIVKEGYEMWMSHTTVPDTMLSGITLHPDKETVLQRREKSAGETEPFANRWTDVAGKDASDPSLVLLSEGFEDDKIFDQWEQTTGGTSKRTWYMQDGALHQHEEDPLLHAIFLGDTGWNDYAMNALVTIGGETGDSRAGLIFRETGDGFYLFRIHKKTDKAQLAYHCKSPFGWNILMEKKLEQDIIGKPYQMAVFAQGNAIGCYLDTSYIFGATADFSKRGRIGFYSVESASSFDELLVSRTIFKTRPTPSEKTNEVISFWFTDNFDYRSTWWHQYREDGNQKRPYPWFFSDAGMALAERSAEKSVSEFTRYLLADFRLNVVLSTGEAQDSSELEVFFRKHGDTHLAFLLAGRDKSIRLILHDRGETKELQKGALPSGFFGGIEAITLIANGNYIACATSKNVLFEHSGKRLPLSVGRFGFSTRQLPLVVHQLNVTSAGDEQMEKKK